MRITGWFGRWCRLWLVAVLGLSRRPERGVVFREYAMVFGLVAAMFAGVVVVAAPQVGSRVVCVVTGAVTGSPAGCAVPSGQEGGPGRPGPLRLGRSAASSDEPPDGATYVPTVSLLAPNATTTVYGDVSTLGTTHECSAAALWWMRNKCAQATGSELFSTAYDLTAVLDIAGCPGASSRPLPAGRLDLTLVKNLDGEPAAYLANSTGTLLALDDLPRDDPVLLGAVGTFLAKILSQEVNAGLEPGQQYRGFDTADREQLLLGALAEPIATITDVLGDRPGSLSCDAVGARLTELANGVIPGGATYHTVCRAPRLDGTCDPADWVAVPLQNAPATDPTAGYTTADGTTVALSPELAAAIPGIVPGQPTATLAEATEYCRTHAQDCAAKLETSRTAAATASFGLLVDLGLCTTAAECAAVGTSLAAALNTPPTPIGRQPLAYPNPPNWWKIIANVVSGGVATSIGAGGVLTVVNGANQTVAGTDGGNNWGIYLAGFLLGASVTGVFEAIGYGRCCPDPTAAPTGTPGGTPPPGGTPTSTPPPPPDPTQPPGQVVIEMATLTQQALQTQVARQQARAIVQGVGGPDWNALNADQRRARFQQYMQLMGRAGSGV